jgi:hypothetical protein
VAVYQPGTTWSSRDIYRLSVSSRRDGLARSRPRRADGAWASNGARSRARASEAMHDRSPGATFGFPLNVPWCAQAVRRSRAVIVHSRFARDYLVRIGCRTPSSWLRTPSSRRRRRSTARAFGRPPRTVGRGRRGGGRDRGDLNASKGIAETIAALEYSRRRSGSSSSGGRDRIGRSTRSCGNPDGDRVTVVRTVGRRLPRVALRRRRARQRPASAPWRDERIVGPRAPARHPDDRQCDRVLPRRTRRHRRPDPPDPGPRRPGGIDRPLAADASARAAMGTGPEPTRRRPRPRVTAEAYGSAIDGVLALGSLVALARWAGALRSHRGPGDAARGFGLRYAEGLAEFGHPS